jgi:hypothetical protein
MTSKKVTRDDLRAAAEKYKNWGKWGPDDEIGTLNYTSPEDIVAAAQLVKKGKVISASIRCTPCCAPAPTPIRACSTSAASAPPTTWW